MAIALAGQAVTSGSLLAADAELLTQRRAGVGAHAARSDDVIDALEASGLLGRGGAGFPVGRKWRAIADRTEGRAVVVVNGAEGEPASSKDRVLMRHRPQLVLDGAELAAGAIGADEVVVYVGSEHTGAVLAMATAIAERSADRPPDAPSIRLARAPVGYVAGEATAAVHYLNAGIARPTTSPPRMSERGVGGRPTLVQNVESLAWAALIARFGPDWYRRSGRASTAGRALVTVSGSVPGQGVREIELGTTVRELLADAGGDPGGHAAVLLGGYFGTWARLDQVLDLPLDPVEMRAIGLTFGCGLVRLLALGECGLAETARLLRFLSDGSAGQCGPCLWGLRSIADGAAAVAEGRGGEDTARRLEEWAALVTGRGACRHPDGAAQLLTSALATFGDDVEAHLRGRACVATGMRPEAFR